MMPAPRKPAPAVHLVDVFDEAVHEFAFIGAQPPEQREAIEIHYKRAKSQLEAYIHELRTDNAAVRRKLRDIEKGRSTQDVREAKACGS